MADIHVLALIHEESGTFGVSFPDFPGCIAAAADLDEALRRAGRALALHVEGMIEDGERLPVPRTAREILSDPAFAEDCAGAVLAVITVPVEGRAVRINVTLDRHLLAALDQAAREAGASRSGYLADAVRERLRRGAGV